MRFGRRFVCVTKDSKRSIALLLSFIIMSNSEQLIADENTWDIQFVDTAKQFHSMSTRSIVTDEDGTVHIVYGGDNLYYATFHEGSWQLTTIDNSPAVGTFASIALDSHGNPHIAYFDYRNWNLKYSYHTEAVWHVEIVDESNYTGLMICLALDNLNRPHISYFNYASQSLYYALRDDTGWSTVMVDNDGNTGWDTSISIDGLNRPHIVYRNMSQADLKYAYLDSTTWYTEIISLEGSSGPSIGIDSSGTPCVSFGSSNSLKFARREESGWEYEVVGEGFSTYTSLSFTPQDQPMISCYQEPEEDLVVTYYDGSIWQSVVVDSVGDSGISSSLWVDKYGTPHVSYLQSGNLRYAFREDTHWKTMTVDVTGIVGKGCSLALNSFSFPYIAYLDDWNDNLKFARCDVSGWDIQTVDLANNVSSFISISVDGWDHAHVSYFESNPNCDLKYGYWDGISWWLETVDTDGYVGIYNSISVDCDSVVHIAYINNTNSTLRYARKDNTGWMLETVDNNAWSSTSLAVDTDGKVGIAYMAASGVKYAEKNAESWQIDSIYPGGGHPSLVFDQSGLPHISYETGVGSYDLMYAWRTVFGWRYEIVDRNGSYRQNSLCLDSGNNPRIAYFNATNDHIKFSYRIDHEWHNATVDQAGDIGVYNSLAVDVSDGTHIAYFDMTGGDLKYAFRPQNWVVLSGAIDGEMLTLTWSPVPEVIEYWIYGAEDHFYFHPGFSPTYDNRLAVLPGGTTSWQTSNGIGDPESNWSYMILAVNNAETEITRSNRIGEYDFAEPLP